MIVRVNAHINFHCDVVIPGTGEYFAPILHFMRSGLVVIPDGMNVEALKGEAEFYLVTTFTAKLQEREEAQRKLAEEQEQCKQYKRLPVYASFY